MFTTFGSDSRKILQDARNISWELQAPALDAEHLLLAVARRPGTAAYDVLVEAGLDYERVRDALDAEFEESLAAVGVTLADFGPLPVAAPPRTPRWGASAKLALQRSAKIAEARRDRRITPGHILLGVLRAPAGTVPRALDRAGFDRQSLSLRLAAAL
jgi:ATP-dependent Clp protease ATP-binding subunit ClpA